MGNSVGPSILFGFLLTWKKTQKQYWIAWKYLHYSHGFLPTANTDSRLLPCVRGRCNWFCTNWLSPQIFNIRTELILWIHYFWAEAETDSITLETFCQFWASLSTSLFLALYLLYSFNTERLTTTSHMERSLLHLWPCTFLGSSHPSYVSASLLLPSLESTLNNKKW